MRTKTSQKQRYKHHRNNHHIIPQSRGGTDEEFNIARVDMKLHDLYHKLILNMLKQIQIQ